MNTCWGGSTTNPEAPSYWKIAIIVCREGRKSLTTPYQHFIPPPNENILQQLPCLHFATREKTVQKPVLGLTFRPNGKG